MQTINFVIKLKIVRSSWFDIFHWEINQMPSFSRRSFQELYVKAFPPNSSEFESSRVTLNIESLRLSKSGTSSNEDLIFNEGVEQRLAV